MVSFYWDECNTILVKVSSKDVGWILTRFILMLLSVQEDVGSTGLSSYSKVEMLWVVLSIIST